MGIIVPRVARRLVNGKAPQPGWLPRRWLTVLSGDMDLDGGIGAVWLVWRPRSAKAETHTALIERCGGHWQYTGGSSVSGVPVAADRSARQPGQIGMIEIGAEAGGLSYAYRLLPTHSITLAPWVGASELQVAAEVSHLLLGERRIKVPGHGMLIVAWKSRYTGIGGLRPLIVAVGRDGSELSRIGPHDSMDSYTWAMVSGQQELLHAKLDRQAAGRAASVRGRIVPRACHDGSMAKEHRYRISRAVHERWLTRLNRRTGDPGYLDEWYRQQCGSCRRWIPLSGQAGLDWGACTHEQSELDGHVRFEHDGCSHHEDAGGWQTPVPLFRDAQET
jgi:hypothetical protein